MLEGRDRHGYEIGQRIEQLSEGRLAFQAGTLYPLLYKLEQRGLVSGRWVEKPGERRRRFYRLTAEGRRALGSQRRLWREFFEAVDRVGQVGRA
jgi:DNA-binding PadR family transcriptional regulator